MRPDQDAFLEKLYRTYFQQLYKYACCALDNQDLAEEVVQDAFHEAVHHIDKLMIHPNPGGWLRLTVKNKIAHSRRDINRYMLRFVSLDANPTYENVIPSVEESHPQQAESLLQAIRNLLTDEEWILLRRITLEKRSYKLVAKEFGVTVWTCQKRIQRIREKLRQSLKDYL